MDRALSMVQSAYSGLSNKIRYTSLGILQTTLGSFLGLTRP